MRFCESQHAVVVRWFARGGDNLITIRRNAQHAPQHYFGRRRSLVVVIGKEVRSPVPIHAVPKAVAIKPHNSLLGIAQGPFAKVIRTREKTQTKNSAISGSQLYLAQPGFARPRVT